MSWNPFKKQQDTGKTANQPEQAKPNGEALQDDDPTNPLVEAGSIEERAISLERASATAAYERVELWGEAGVSSMFLRISIADHGKLADTLHALWLNLPEEHTGFSDLLVNSNAALCAKFTFPDSLQASANGAGQGSEPGIRPVELMQGLQAIATLLAQVKRECGWVWPTPNDAGLGWNTAPGLASGLDCNTVQFIAWDELAEADETQAAQALAAMFIPALSNLAEQATASGFSFGQQAIAEIIEELNQAANDAQLSYKSLADRLAAFQHGIQLLGMTDVGRRRNHNEDAYMLLDLDQTSGIGARLNLAAIADGMGGHSSGEIASNLSLSLLRQHLLGGLLAPSSKPVNAIQLKAQLETAIPSIDRALTERAAMDAALAGMGTTLVGLAVLTPQSTLAGQGAINPPAACVFWVGDSRAYLLGPGGIAPLTKDHSHVQNLLDAGSITPEEARSHKMKNVITRCLGGSEKADGTPDVEWFTPGHGELVLLCSDGLSDVLDEQQIWDIVCGSQGASLNALAQALIDAANAGGGPDNITVVLVQ